MTMPKVDYSAATLSCPWEERPAELTEPDSFLMFAADGYSHPMFSTALNSYFLPLAAVEQFGWRLSGEIPIESVPLWTAAVAHEFQHSNEPVLLTGKAVLAECAEAYTALATMAAGQSGSWEALQEANRIIGLLTAGTVFLRELWATYAAFDHLLNADERPPRRYDVAPTRDQLVDAERRFLAGHAKQFPRRAQVFRNIYRDVKFVSAKLGRNPLFLLKLYAVESPEAIYWSSIGTTESGLQTAGSHAILNFNSYRDEENIVRFKAGLEHLKVAAAGVDDAVSWSVGDSQAFFDDRLPDFRSWGINFNNALSLVDEGAARNEAWWKRMGWAGFTPQSAQTVLRGLTQNQGFYIQPPDGDPDSWNISDPVDRRRIKEKFLDARRRGRLTVVVRPKSAQGPVGNFTLGFAPASNKSESAQPYLLSPRTSALVEADEEAREKRAALIYLLGPLMMFENLRVLAAHSDEPTVTLSCPLQSGTWALHDERVTRSQPECCGMDDILRNVWEEGVKRGAAWRPPSNCPALRRSV